MPLITESDYRAPRWFKNRHVQTIFPTVFRRVSSIPYRRERLETPDGDFVDLDWSQCGHPRVAVLLHGLEGHSERKYMLGMVRALNAHGIDTVSLNFRGCSGEPNRKLHFYHSGFTADLHTVVQHLDRMSQYQTIDLIGFSIGGNQTLKYLGENRPALSKKIRKAVCFSVPIDLSACAKKMDEPPQAIYLKRFLRMFKEKIVQKRRQWQGADDESLNLDGFEKIKSFFDFDNRYTAPLFGYKSAQDYYAANSSRQFLPNISVPTLLITALDDPFLDENCFPIELAKTHNFLHLETPRQGGHMGFVSKHAKGLYWSEARALKFLGTAPEALAQP